MKVIAKNMMTWMMMHMMMCCIGICYYQELKT